MSESDGISGQLKAAFGHCDLYVLFGVDRSADAGAIKKAYMKQALVHHPDKGGDKEKFQAISVAYSILSDADKRSLYDRNGFLDDSDDQNSESFEFWYKYFRDLFPAISAEDIDSFGRTYIGSDEERNDVLEAYRKYKGDLRKIMDSVMFAEAGEEQRIVDLIDSAISAGDLETTKQYTTSKQRELAASAKGAKGKKKRKAAAATAAAAEDDDADFAALREQIQNRRAQQAQTMNNIFDKYTTSDSSKSAKKQRK